MTGRALIVQGDALRLPLPDGSVDLIVTSPPFFALRAYDAPGHQVGSEPTPQAYLEALWAATAEMVRVLKPTGSIFVNLGDKYNSAASGQNGTGATGLYDGKAPPGVRRPAGRHDRMGERGTAFRGYPPKSLMLLPERYRVGCVDRLGLIARAVIVWDKPNGLPESVTDRVRRSHEDWVHLMRQPRYYSATDEIREAYHPATAGKYAGMGPEGWNESHAESGASQNPSIKLKGVQLTPNPLGKLPGSVWTIASEPLTLPGYFTFSDGVLLDFLAPERGSQRPRANGHHPGLFDLDPYAEVMASGDGGAWRWMRATGVTSSPWPQIDTGLQLRTAASHYAAFPSRWPEQLIKGFSPPGICVECGQGRVPVVERLRDDINPEKAAKRLRAANGAISGGTARSTLSDQKGVPSATILGYACACTPHTDHPGSGEQAPEWGHGTTGNVKDDGRYAGSHLLAGLGARPRTGPWREYHLDRWTPPPTRPAVVLDPFSGTGTTPMVARALGRIGIGVDLSHAYCRAARWRVAHDGAKAISRTWKERQGTLDVV